SYTKTDSVEEATKAIAKICPNYAITKGNKGSTIKFNDIQLDIPAYSTKAIDTTGAGDMFAGAFMYGIINADSTVRAGHLGSFASSKIVAQQGARLSEDHIELRNTIFNKIDK
ncbi:MAG: adenosine kinase, partial [Chlorobi bacterium]|nr:adenosine kinase [Chlorobiota bacterium]